MTEFADPELLIGEWLRDLLGVKVWLDPDPPDNRWATAPWVWLQRAQGGGAVALSLDDVLLDCDSYAAKADNARNLGQRVRTAMMLQLPLTTFGNGIFVKAVSCFSAPAWAPDPQSKRAAAYRVILHGLV